MAKTSWKPGNMIYPLPAVMVTCRDKGQDNIITIAWTGTICTNPPMTYISVRPERHSYEIFRHVFTLLEHYGVMSYNVKIPPVSSRLSDGINIISLPHTESPVSDRLSYIFHNGCTLHCSGFPQG